MEIQLKILHQLREDRKLQSQSGKTIFALQCCPWELCMDTAWDITYKTARIVMLTSKDVGLSADPMGS